jgi:hypothetical protein
MSPLLPARTGALTAPSVAPAARAARARFLCTPPPRPENATVTIVKQVITWAKQNRTVVGVLLATSVVMYGFYRGSMRLMRFFFNVTDKQVFTIGFGVGMVSVGAVAAAVFMAQRRYTFHVDQVYHAALRKLRAHAAVETALGEFWRPSGFRGYKVESLKEAIQGSDRRARSSFFEAPSRRVQMIFMVRGLERDGMVSLEAHKRGIDYNFSMLSLDVKPDAARGLSSQHIFLEGSSDVVLFKDLAEVLGDTRTSGRPESQMADEEP